MNFNKLIVFLVFILFFAVNLSAEDDFGALFDEIENELEENSTADNSKAADTEETNMSFKEEDFTLEISGEHLSALRLSFISEYMDFDEFYRTPKVRNIFGLDIGYKNLKIVSNWKLYLLAGNKAEEIARVTPLENALFIKSGGFNISAGYQLFNWGTADIINPTDNLNPHDYTKGPDSEKLPVFSLGIKYFPINEISLEVVYIPFKTESVINSSAENMLSEQFPYTEIKQSSLDLNFKNSVTGVKAGFYLPALDFSLSYIYNYTDIPVPEISVIPAGPVYIPESINFMRKRVHQWGFDIRTNIGRFGLWNETCFSFIQGYKNNNTVPPQLNWVFGMDFNFGRNSRHYFNAQYLGFYTFNYDDSFYSDYSGGIPEPGMSENYYDEYFNRLIINRLSGINEGFLQGISFNTELDFADSAFCPSFTAAYFLPLIYNEKINNNNVPVSYNRLGSWILQASFDFMPFDSFHIILGTDLYVSLSRINGDIQIDETDRIGSNYKYSTVYIEINYKWGIGYKTGN